MDDITILFLTINKVPKEWAEYQKETLLKAACGAPIITISKEPMDWGINILQTEPPSFSNIYLQMLKGAKIATTEYIGIAEDDALYSEEHFRFRPKEDEFAYNMTHWSLFTWGQPIYGWKNRTGNYSMICPRKLLIEALEERFAKYPNGTPEHITGELGRDRVNRNLRLKLRKLVTFGTNDPIVVLFHDYELDKVAREHRKRLAMIRALDIPYWGKAEELVKHFK